MINLRLSALLVLGLTTTLAACGGYGGGGTSIASGLGGRGAPDRHDGNAEESVSGAIAPSTMSVKLRTPGTYFIGCAFHYMAMHSMCGVIEVRSNAAPGAQAAPPAGSGGGTGGGGTEY